MTKKVVTFLQKNFIAIFLIFLVSIWLIRFSGALAAPERQAQDLAIITNPPSNAVVQGVVQITGSADHPSFQYYVIEFSPEPVTGDQWTVIQDLQRTPVVNGGLITWDTTAIPDGSYTLRLRTVRLDGNYNEFFVQQVVVANTQPVATDTPTPGPITGPTEPEVSAPPTATPTDLPPTATIVVDQPIVDTPTPRPVETSAPLEDPEENQTFIPTVTGFSMTPLQDACLYGGALMVGIFVFFGFLSALRMFIMGFVNRRRF